MPTFNPILASAMLCCACSPAFADELTLSGSSKLSGDILSMSPNGIIELQSPLSLKPLKIKAALLQQATFSPAPDASPLAHIRVRLVNGDILAATDVIEMQEQSISVNTLGSGIINIPISAIESIQFGVAPNPLLYSSKIKPIPWIDTNEEKRSWQQNNDMLTIEGSGTLTHAFDLPEDFIISFQLEWNPKTPTYFHMAIASTENSSDNHSGLYRFSLTQSNITLERHTQDKKQYFLAQLRRPRSDANKNSLDVEIHVKRSQKRIELFLDGQPEGRYADPSTDTPNGNCISMTYQANDGTSQHVKNFKILSISNFSTRHLAENRSNPETDVIITTDDDRIPGKLHSISSKHNSSLVTFINETLKAEPIEFPQSVISTIFFAVRPHPEIPPFDRAQHQLVMPNEGKLQIHAYSLNNDILTVNHPLLGSLQIDKSYIHAITHGSY